MLLLLISVLSVSADAAESTSEETWFLMQSVEKERADSYLSKIKLTRFTEEPIEAPIHNFDVNHNDQIAVGFDSIGKDLIGVYDSNGTLLYGYRSDSNSPILVKWDHDNLEIYYTKSSLVITVDPDGNVLSVEEIINTPDSYRYWNVLEAQERTVGDTTYVIRNKNIILKILSPISYSQILKISSNGQETVIYDVTVLHIMRCVFISLVLVSGFGVPIVYFIRKIKNNFKTSSVSVTSEVNTPAADCQADNNSASS